MAIEIESKSLVIGFNPKQIKKYNPQVLTITQQYLRDESKEKSERRVRKIIYSNGCCSHFLTKKIQISQVSREEIELDITEQEFKSFLSNEAHPDCKEILKVRYEFDYKVQFFQLDVYKAHLRGLVTLEHEVITEEALESIVFPPELHRINVTGRKEFSNRSLAQFGIPPIPV